MHPKQHWGGECVYFPPQQTQQSTTERERLRREGGEQKTKNVSWCRCGLEHAGERVDAAPKMVWEECWGKLTPKNHTALTTASAAAQNTAAADAVGKNAVVRNTTAETSIVATQRSQRSSSLFFWYLGSILNPNIITKKLTTEKLIVRSFQK